MILNMNFN